MATYTADAAQSYVQPRLNYRGKTSIISRYDAGGVTISSGDVYLMCKIPHGATIIGAQGYGKAGGSIVFSFGTPASASLFGTFTISATHQYVNLTTGASATQQFPYTVSLSDAATPRYVYLALTMASGSTTATGSFGLVIDYLMPGNSAP